MSKHVLPLALTLLLIVGLFVIGSAVSANAKNCHATKTCPPSVTTTSTTSKSSTTTTSIFRTTTTTIAACAVLLSGCSVWSAGMENGSISEWQQNGGGNAENSGSFTVAASQEQAHNGSWSVKATIDTSGGTSGVRMFRWEEPRKYRDAIYEANIYIPERYTLSHDPASGQFWNLFQFKSRSTAGRNDPVWAFYLQQDSGGLYLQAGYGWGGTQLPGAGQWFQPITKTYMPVGQWVHLKASLHQSSNGSSDGSIDFWQDTTQLFHLTNIITSYNNCNYNSWCASNEWSVNLYSDGTTPNPARMYIDDAAISVP